MQDAAEELVAIADAPRVDAATEPPPDADDAQGDAQEPVAVTPAKSEKDIEKAMTALAKEAERHAGAVNRIMGEDALELELCPLCWPGAPGFRFPGEPEPAQLEAVLEAIGRQPSADYANAGDARKCDDCNGLGEVLTGSLAPKFRLKLCAPCNGTGYVMVPGPPAGNGASQVSTAPSPVPVAAAEPAPEADFWGRTREHPDYGRMPQFVR